MKYQHQEEDYFKQKRPLEDYEDYLSGANLGYAFAQVFLGNLYRDGKIENNSSQEKK